MDMTIIHSTYIHVVQAYSVVVADKPARCGVM